MKGFASLFADWRTGLYTTALGLLIITLFLARLFPDYPVNSYAIVLLLVAWLVGGVFRGLRQRLAIPWLWLPILLFVLYALGVLYSDDKETAGRMLEQKLALLLLPVLVGSARQFKSRHLGWSLWVFVLSSAAAMAVAFVLAIINGTSGMYGDITFLDMVTYEKLAGTIGFQPIYLSLYMVFACFAIYALGRFERFSEQFFFGRNVLVALLFFFFFVSVVLLSSRMEIMVLFVSLAVLIVIGVRPLKRQLRYTGVYVAMLLLALLMILGSTENKQRFTEMIDIESDYTQDRYGGRSIRFHKWLNTLERWSENPILGVGTGDMQRELNATYARNDFQLALDYSFNPHNQYLETLLTIGIAGFLTLIAWMGSLCWLGWRHKNWLLLVFGLIASLSMITESMLERQWGIVFICFFATLLISDNFKYFRTESSPQQ